MKRMVFIKFILTTVILTTLVKQGEHSKKDTITSAR